MGAHTITNSFLRKRWRRALALALGLCALAIPTSATAEQVDSDYSTVNAISGDSNGSSQQQAGSDYSSVNSIVPPTTELRRSQPVDAGYSSVNAITGPPAEAPTLVGGPSGSASDEFDWASALVGAGAALAMVALGSAALLAVRRRTSISPSASTG
jgi:hypothetical protein